MPFSESNHHCTSVLLSNTRYLLAWLSHSATQPKQHRYPNHHLPHNQEESFMSCRVGPDFSDLSPSQISLNAFITDADQCREMEVGGAMLLHAWCNTQLTCWMASVHPPPHSDLHNHQAHHSLTLPKQPLTTDQWSAEGFLIRAERTNPTQQDLSPA